MPACVRVFVRGCSFFPFLLFFCFATECVAITGSARRTRRDHARHHSGETPIHTRKNKEENGDFEPLHLNGGRMVGGKSNGEQPRTNSFRRRGDSLTRGRESEGGEGNGKEHSWRSTGRVG